MTPIDALLERLSATVYGAATANRSADESDVRDALERELKPLLEAGERMRDVAMFHGGTPEAERWDRALKGGRDGK